LFIVFFVSNAVTSVVFAIIVVFVVVVKVSESVVVTVTEAVTIAKACPPIASGGLAEELQTELPQASLPQTPLSVPAPYTTATKVVIVAFPKHMTSLCSLLCRLVSLERRRLFASCSVVCFVGSSLGRLSPCPAKRSRFVVCSVGWIVAFSAEKK
jgi:hypothetical protein